MIENTELKVENLITMTGYKTDISQYLIVNNIQAPIVIHLVFSLQKVKKGTPNLTDPYVHGLCTIFLIKQFFSRHHKI